MIIVVIANTLFLSSKKQKKKISSDAKIIKIKHFLEFLRLKTYNKHRSKNKNISFKQKNLFDWLKKQKTAVFLAKIKKIKF